MDVCTISRLLCLLPPSPSSFIVILAKYKRHNNLQKDNEQSANTKARRKHTPNANGTKVRFSSCEQYREKAKRKTSISKGTTVAIGVIVGLAILAVMSFFVLRNFTGFVSGGDYVVPSLVGKNYEARTGIIPAFYVTEAGDGGREIM